MQRPLYLGIDLGTTNSTAVCFDGDSITPVRTSAGATLLPSVVRINAKGQASVGERARRALDSDPANTFAGFKRLLGSQATMTAAASQRVLTPVDLSAEVLKALMHDVEMQTGARPEQAVITVPALFEVPQTTATAQAAKAAGLSRVELLQEPVASALAAGFTGNSDGLWLVYDLGGGTFDASLVQGEGGLLRVVGHDGDNFLGGRDFDAAIVGWLLQMLEADGVTLHRDNPAHQPVLRQLQALAEDAKVELTRADEVMIASATPMVVDGAALPLEYTLQRHVLEQLVMPLIERSCTVCERLMQQHQLGYGDLARVVMVGGPTGMPLVRRLVAERVGALAGAAHDPMTLVAQGAALHAAASDLPMRTTALLPVVVDAHRLLVKAPTMSTDLMPYVVARLVDGAKAHAPIKLRFRRHDSPAWSSEWVPFDSDGTVAVMLELVPRKGNRFTIEAMTASGQSCAVQPTEVAIVHGVTIGDAPVSRSLGVALANNTVRVFIEKGTPLPTKRTFTLHTLETAVSVGGSPAAALRIPLVQGELDDAHLCRLVGTIDIMAADLDRALPAGTAVEITLELDRGGQLTAQAYVPSLKRLFEQVAHLVVPDASPVALASSVGSLLERLATLKQQGREKQWTWLLEKVEGLARDHQEAERALDSSNGGDQEQGQRARRLVLDLDSRTAELEAECRWPEVTERAMDTYVWSVSWVAEYGNSTEQAMLSDAGAAMQRAITSRAVREVERHRRIISRLGHGCFLRSPDAYTNIFDDLVSNIHRSRDLKRAEQLVAAGRAALAVNDVTKLKGICDQLAELLPPSEVEQRKAYSSSLRG